MKHTPQPVQPVTLAGRVQEPDGTSVTSGFVTVTDLGPGGHNDVVAIDPTGSFQSSVPPGDYALAAATARGFLWIERVKAPALDVHLALHAGCHPISGSIKRGGVPPRATLRVRLEHQSTSKGDTFYARPSSNNAFLSCVPEGQYIVTLDGPVASAKMKTDVPGGEPARLTAISAEDLRRAPHPGAMPRSDIDSVVDEIARLNPRIVGLGEATHGTAEFFSQRADLTFELVRRTDLSLIFLENDAIASIALDDYINGADVDLAKAVASLGFWTTDVFEFHKFLRDLRLYNATAATKVHIWGIDLQNTTLPVELLLRSADALAISSENVALLRRLTKRGAGIKEFSVAERANIDALLARLSRPQGGSSKDLSVAVAARSLALQLGYWDGDTDSWASKRRDLGMTALAELILAQTNAKRACVWAHDAHISKESGELRLGYYLSRSSAKYYAVGFYVQAGTARAWDIETKIGVVSQPIPPLREYHVEQALTGGVALKATAWISMRQLPPALARWFDLPRYVRELYAIYEGPEGAEILRDVREGFDAIVIIPTGHDSTPTPTGIRTAP